MADTTMTPSCAGFTSINININISVGVGVGVGVSTTATATDIRQSASNAASPLHHAVARYYRQTLPNRFGETGVGQDDVALGRQIIPCAEVYGQLRG